MDGSSFDRISRRLAVTSSRRRGVMTLVAGALGIAGISAAEAVVPVPPVCRSTGSECTDGAQCCSGRCMAKRLKNGGGSRCARKTSNRKKKERDDGGDKSCAAEGSACDDSLPCCDLRCYDNQDGPICKTCGTEFDHCEEGWPCCPGFVCNDGACAT